MSTLLSTTGTANYGTAQRLVVPAFIDVANYGTGIGGATIAVTLAFSGGVSCSYSLVVPTSASTSAQLTFVSCSNGAGSGSTVSTTSAQISGTTNPAFLAAGTQATATLGISIDDGVPCTVDKCNNGVVDNSGFAPAGTSCDDGNLCNGTEVCAGTSAACNAGTALLVNDNDVCTTDSACNPTTGVTHTRIANCPAVTGLGTALDLTVPRQYQITSGTTSWLQGLTAVGGVGALDAKRAGVLRGRIVRADTGAGLSGVTVRTLVAPTTTVTTDTNGFYDFAVNGGETYTVQASATGWVPVQRTATTRWHDFTVIPDAAMTLDQVPPPGNTVNYNSAVWQNVLGDSIAASGSDLAHRLRVLIPPSTTFSNWNPGASTVTYKITETTVGANGPIAMPGELPYQSAYTFAADLSVVNTPLVNGVRQTLLFANTNAINTAFNGTVVAYVENFTNRTGGGLPNYTNKPGGIVAVPSGSFDMTTGRWQSDDSGQMVRYLGNSGAPSAARFSVDGTNELPVTASPPNPSYTSLGITLAERQHFATLGYSVNTDFWRVPLKHFSALDFNWAGGIPDGPLGPPGPVTSDAKTDCKSDRDPLDQTENHSIVECTNQVLGEDIPVVGTPLSLHYRSETQRGYHPTLTIPLADGRAWGPVTPKRSEVDITVAGQHAVLVYQGVPTPNQKVQWSWDRTDAYGRLVQGTVNAHVRVSYVYGGELDQFKSSYTPTFGAYTNQALIGMNRNTREFAIANTYDIPIGGLDAKPLGLGGWTASMNHVLEPETGVVWLGYGGKRAATAWPDVVKDAVTLGAAGSGFYDLVVAPDGQIYISDNGPWGQLFVWNGSTLTALSVLNGSSAIVSGVTTVGSVGIKATGLAIGPDNRLYIADGGRVLSMDRTTKVLTLVAGLAANNLASGTSAPDGATPIGTMLGDLKHIAVSKDGAVYVAENATSSGEGRIRRIAPNGKLETVVGGGGTAIVGNCGGACKGLGVSTLGIDAFTLDEAGAIIFAAKNDLRVWRMNGDGSLSRLLGDGVNSNITGDGGLATGAQTTDVKRLAARGETLFVSNNGRVRKISAGIITTALGGGAGFADGRLASTVSVIQSDLFAVPSPDGFMYAAGIPGTASNKSLLRFGRVEDSGLPSFRYVPDGDVVYKFDAVTGQHLATLSRFHGQPLYTFSYVTTAGTNFGKLQTITDNTEGANNTIDFTYVSATQVTIKAFFDKVNQTTTLTLSSSGYLSALANPLSERFNFTYSPTTSGLLATLIDPRGGSSSTHNFTFDPNGLLLVDRDPAGLPGLRLTRGITAGGTSVTVASAEGHLTSHVVTPGVASFTHKVTDGAGIASTFTRALDRSTTLDLPVNSGDVRKITTKSDADPRWGLTEPVDTEVVSTDGPVAAWSKRTVSRSVTNPTPSNPFAFTDQTDTVTRTRNPSGVGDPLGNIEVKVTNGVSTTSVVSKNLSTLRQVTAAYDIRDRLNQITVAGNVPSNPLVAPAITAITAWDHGRPKTITQTAGSTVRTVDVTYNATTGRVDQVATPLGTVKYQNYDAAGRPRTITLPSLPSPQRTMTLTYDANGNVLTMVPLTQTHQFTPNGVDLLTVYTPPAGSWGASGSTGYVYDKDRFLRSIFEPQAQSVAIDREVAGRLDTVRMPTIDGEDVRKYTYDPAGHLSALSSVINGVNNTTLAYYYSGDRATQMRTDIYNGGTLWSNRVTNWTYDDFGRVRHREFDVGTAPFDYGYDAEGNLSTISTGGYVYTINRTAGSGASAGSLVSSTDFGGLGNALHDAYEYDAFGGLTKYTFWMGGTLKYQVTYGREAATGRVLTKTEYIPDQGLSNCVHSYMNGSVPAYDAQNYLTNVVASGCGSLFSGALSRDTAGNLNGLHTFDLAQNRMTGDLPPTSVYDYDADGNVTGIRPNGSSTTSYGFSYDVPGNLRRSSPYIWAGSGYFRYAIDGNDHRVARFATNGISDPNEGWLYEGNRVIAHLETGGYVQNAFAYGTKSNVPDLMLRFYSDAPGGGPRFDLYRIVSDQLGSPILVIKVAGTTPESSYSNAVLESFAWDEFGNANGSFPQYQPFGFAGGIWDRGTWMYRFGARDYSRTGVWWNKDPVRFGGGWNHYLYANGDPVNFFDPSGTTSVFLWGSMGVENEGPIRVGGEVIGLGGYDSHDGPFVGFIPAVGAAVGGTSNYGAVYGGREVSASVGGGLATDDIRLAEVGLGWEVPFLVGSGTVIGGFRQGGAKGEYGIFVGGHHGAFGEHGAAGVGFGFPDRWNRWLDAHGGVRLGHVSASGSAPCPASGAAAP